MTVNEFTAERRKYDDQIITLKMFELKKSLHNTRKTEKRKKTGVGGQGVVGRIKKKKKKEESFYSKNSIKFF